jgi:hypothetical protein
MRTTFELKLDRLQKTKSHQVLSPSYQKKSQTTGDSLPAEAVKKLNAIPEAKGRPSKHWANKAEENRSYSDWTKKTQSCVSISMYLSL